MKGTGFRISQVFILCTFTFLQFSLYVDKYYYCAILPVEKCNEMFMSACSDAIKAHTAGSKCAVFLHLKLKYLNVMQFYKYFGSYVV